MGNTCTNCSQCKGDNGESNEVVTVDNKVSIIFAKNSAQNRFTICGFYSKFLFC